LDKRTALAGLKAQGLIGQDKAQEDYLERTFELGKADLRKGLWKWIRIIFGLLAGFYVVSLLLWNC
jgi:hypothetical protein